MTENEIRQAVLDIILDVSGRDELPDIAGGESLRDQVDLDSMDFLDIVMELRKRHKIEVPEADYGQLATLDSTVAYLTPRMG